MTYDLTRFSPQSFERFVQALSSETLGAGVQIYGSGRDGGREATYEGRCKLAGEEWDGYVVIQAKYNVRPSTLRENAIWLIAQIDRELAKYADKKRDLRKPDFYLLATNVRLGAAAGDHEGVGEGGLDKVLRHLQAATRRLGFKGVHLWHADTLETLIDTSESARTTFSFWVQPGDVLAAALRKLAGPAKEDVLYRYLRRTLSQSRDVKTRDAGQITGKTIVLDDVFIDLPVELAPAADYLQSFEPTFLEAAFDHGDGDPTDEEDESGVQTLAWFERDRKLVVSSLMTACADKFEFARDDESKRAKRRNPLPNRVVLLGGPGQGKSTVGQFLAQLCRARLLRATDADRAPELRSAVEAILRRAEEEGIPHAGPLRFPFHVELPRFADALSAASLDGKALSIIGHLAERISSQCEESIEPALLIDWFRNIPSIVVLDGLDEIPHSGNRADVISAVKGFVEDVHDLEADSFVLVTSRPQGYQEELPRRFWHHWEMDHLGEDDALRYAGRLSLVLVADALRRNEILEIITQAASDEVTAPLMISPLQVTLLFSLVETRNNIPKDRWTLFHRHYEILRDREIAKGGRAGQVIGDYKSQIDRIHYDSGYLLHLRAEAVGGAHAFFTVPEFETLIAKQLQADGFDTDLGDLTKEIATIATNRLVFLGCSTDGQIAFDVRSLQEFMAAARLTTSPEEKIAPRLREIGGRAHWLHVFKIACSKIYAQASSESLRDVVLGVLDGLDNGDRDSDDLQARTGSRLAGQLVLDGIAHSVPAHRRKLAIRALNLLETGDRSGPALLIGVVDHIVKPALEPQFAKLLTLGGETARGALRLLLLLADARDPTLAKWAETIVLERLPSTPEEVLQVFNENSLIPKRKKLLDRLRAAMWAVGPGELKHWEFALERDEDEWNAASGVIIFSSGRLSYQKCILRGSDSSRTDVEFRFLSLRQRLPLKRVPSSATLEWHVLARVNTFMRKLSVEELANLLEYIAENCELPRIRQMPLPWLLSELISQVSSSDELLTVAADVKAGLYGDRKLWLACEKKWISNGITVCDVVARLKSAGPAAESSLFSAPLNTLFRISGDAASGIRELVEIQKSEPESRWASFVLLSYIRRAPAKVKGKVPREELVRIVVKANAAERTQRAQAMIALLSRKGANEDIIDYLVSVSTEVLAGLGSTRRSLGGLMEAFNGRPECRDLLPVIASAARSFARPSPETLKLLDGRAFEYAESDTPRVVAAVTILRFLSSRTEVNGAPSDADYLVEAGTSFYLPFLRHLERLQGRRPEAAALAIAMSRQILGNPEKGASNEASRIMSHFIEAQRTRLGDGDVSLELSLPTYVRPELI